MDELIGTPCMGCEWRNECDYCHDYENCEENYVKDEQREGQEV